MGKFSVNMDRFSLGDLLVGQEGKEGLLFADDPTALVFERPIVAGYLLEQVVRGRTELATDELGGHVSTLLIDTLGELIETEGGQQLRYDPDYGHSNMPGITLLQAGQYVIECARISIEYGDGTRDPMLRASEPRVADCATEKGAAATFRLHAGLIEHSVQEEGGTLTRITAPIKPFDGTIIGNGPVHAVA